LFALSANLLACRGNILKKERAGLAGLKVAAWRAIRTGHPVPVDGATSRRIVDAERGGHCAFLNGRDNTQNQRPNTQDISQIQATSDIARKFQPNRPDNPQHWNGGTSRNKMLRNSRVMPQNLEGRTSRT
jgi:hypothetical protein